MFLTIEGGEGAGKSTLAARLAQALSDQGITPCLTAEPGGTPLAHELRTLLLHKKDIPLSAKSELLLFLAARLQHLEEKILPALARGEWVICDRFHDSTIVYQGVGRGLGMEWVAHLCDELTDQLWPDRTLLLDLDPHKARRRLIADAKEEDRFEGEEFAFHQRIREGFLAWAKQHPQRISLLDGTLSPDALFQAAWQLLQEKKAFSL